MERNNEGDTSSHVVVFHARFLSVQFLCSTASRQRRLRELKGERTPRSTV